MAEAYPEDIATPMEEEEYLAEGNEEGAEVEEIAEVDAEIAEVERRAATEQLAQMGTDMTTDSFDELVFDSQSIDEIQQSWKMLVGMFPNSGACADALYTAIFDSAPSLQDLFTTPRAVQAMRFADALNNYIVNIGDPAALKTLVEAVAFAHMDKDVTRPRAAIIKDAILGFATAELGNSLSSTAAKAWTILLNYIGGAIMFVKANYSGRVALLRESWMQANRKGEEGAEKKEENQAESHGEEEGQEAKTEEETEKQKQAKSKVPTSYNEMFTFNAAVMGMGNRMWMREVLDVWENIVLNVANSKRLEEECDILMLRISKVVGTESVKLPEYKACMLSTLRGMLPKDWTSQHEVAWTWLWENVERLVNKNMGNPPKWEKALTNMYASLNEAQKYEIRGSIYEVFFATCPQGEDYFKQSTTYLHYIIDCIFVMTVKVYNDPVALVDEASGVGLRHVGYGVSTDLFVPYISCACDVAAAATPDAVAVESYSWSLGLIGRTVTRTILEGSTLVMKAINVNTKRSINLAVAQAPRGERAKWQLRIQVGTQSISPLMWAIDSGALESAYAILIDLSTFRADRDKYYYGVDDLFGRHPEIVHTLCTNAPTLLNVFFDGMIWRSRVIVNGQRRVNYYIKHLVQDEHGGFAKAISWVISLKDPRLACHTVISVLTDLMWNRVASWAFIQKKVWFLLTLAVYITSQSLQHRTDTNSQYALFVSRLFIYVFCLCVYAITHVSRSVKAYRRKNTRLFFGTFPVPVYLTNWQDALNLFLTIVLGLMAALEPLFLCLMSPDEPPKNKDDTIFVDDCSGVGDGRHTAYGFFACLAMLVQFVLVIDMAAFSNKVSAYTLVCGRMLSEVGLFCLALCTMILCFSAAICALKQDNKDFDNMLHSFGVLFEMVFRAYPFVDYEEIQDEPVVFIAIIAFLIIVVVFFINMLIGQLNCAYKSIYIDMVGYARLRRMDIVVEMLSSVSQKRWKRFIAAVAFDERIEFAAGDLGVAGGIAITEPGNLNPVSTEQINRFGGSTSPALPWPEDDAGDDNEEAKFEKLQKLLVKGLARLSKGSGNKGAAGGSASGGSAGGAGESGSAGVSGVSDGANEDA
jgi:hemoglobin-like flavoprotein/uncharacterized membrane protein YgcG